MAKETTESKKQGKKVNKNSSKENSKKNNKKVTNSQKENLKENKRNNSVKEVKQVKRDTTQENVKEEKKIQKKVENKKSNEEKVVNTLKKIDDNRKAIILFVVGFLIATLLFRCILWPDRIATLKDGTQPVAKLGKSNITADDLYASMKEHYSVSVFLDDVDNMILTEMYPEDDTLKSEVNNTAEYYYSVYEKNYGYTKEKFLTEYGFATEEDFLETLKLDYRRNKYYDEYVEKTITDKEIEKYYNDNVFGDVDSKHILVAIDEEDGLSDSEAKKLAQEIIKKLDNGTSWDDVIKEYDDKITHEELGYNAFNASLEKTYLEECKNLKVGTYSKTPVLTSYGYHIVYKIDQKDKPKLKDVKDDIIEVLVKEKKDNDSNLYYKALINMRKEAKLEFVDTKLSDEYKSYVSKYN